MESTAEVLVRSTLEGRRLLSHPFYQRWEAGELAMAELTQYAEQYRFFESYLPEFLSSLADRLEDGPARNAVVANLCDETSSPSHLSLFEQFANAFGARSAPISSAMSWLLRAYQTALDEGEGVALAGLLAYEVQGAEIAETKKAGLVRHYGATSPGIDFWTVHGSLEDDHARWTLEGIEALSPEPEAVVRGVDLVASAWWEFLNERDSLALVS